jgi:riboflavin synthase
MATGARYGGHFVQGHVDFTVTIASITPDGTSLRYVFSVPSEASEHLPALLPKGYVTLDGTSLTLTMVNDAQAQFGIMLIEHSQQKVVLTHKKVGDKVNVEVDIVAKGVEKVVNKMLSGQGSALEQIIERAVNKALAAKGIQ